MRGTHPDMARVTYVQPDGSSRTVTNFEGMAVMHLAVGNLVDGIDALCGGVMQCGTCHVYVDPAWVAKLPKKQAMEEDMLDFAWKPDPERSRLTCQIKVTDALDGLRVTMPERQI